MARPRIGYVRCHKDQDYMRSLESVGAFVMTVDPEGDPSHLLREVDGLVLPGGDDVDPTRYDERLHPTCALAGGDRDAYELEIARRCLREGLPLLAICRGMQVLNVAAGGSLIQDIPSQVPVAQPHAVPDTLTSVAHELEVVPGSLIERAVGQGMSVRVNSRHHQAMKVIGAGLHVSAYASDGIVEAIEAPGAAFCVGVQWHPENFWESGEFLPLFRMFTQACLDTRAARLHQ